MFEKKRDAAHRINALMEADGFSPIKIGEFNYEAKLVEYIEYLRRRIAPVVYEREPLQ